MPQLTVEENLNGTRQDETIDGGLENWDEELTLSLHIS